jgi:nucleoid-associated protein YgaU
VYATAAERAPREHVVLAGETLAEIARIHYGDPARAPEILAANAPRIADPKRLTPGARLVIP